MWWAINWFAAEIKAGQLAEEEKQRRLDENALGEDTETEAETVIETTDKSGSKEVEVVPQKGELIDRLSGTKSEISTEDEWERVSENEKDK